jgi:hypothetical protein
VLERWYGKLLAFSMERRWVVGIVMILALVSIPFVGARVPTGFLPTDDEGRFEITVEAPQGTSLAETEIIAERLARQVRALPEVEHTVLMVGSAEGDISGRGSHEALIYVGMVDQTERERSELDVEEYIRAEFLPGFTEREQAKAEISRISGFGGSGPQSAPIQYLLRGPDFAALEQYSNALAEELGQQTGVSQADTTFREGRPELRVEIDRPRAAELGVTVAAIADALRILVGGADVTEIAVAGEQFDVNLRAGEAFRRSAEDLDRYQIRALDGRLVPLSQVARVVEGVGPAAIEHVGRERSVMVYATTLPGASTAQLIQTLDRTADSLDMPPSYSTALTGSGARVRQGRARLRHRHRALVHLHVLDHRGPVRELDLPHQHLGLAAPHGAVRAGLGAHLRTVAERVLHAGVARALRHREEELHLAGGPHAHAAARGLLEARRHHAGQPRPPATHPDDHHRVRGRHGAPPPEQGRGQRHQPRHRGHRSGRADAGAVAHAGGDTGDLLLARRRPEGDLARRGEVAGSLRWPRDRGACGARGSLRREVA